MNLKKLKINKIDRLGNYTLNNKNNKNKNSEKPKADFNQILENEIKKYKRN